MTEIRTVLLDFGGVVAEEGFRCGLEAIARRARLDPGEFFVMARELIYESGFIVGRVDEHAYWSLIRERSGISLDDAELRAEILSRFIVRPWMRELVESLREQGVRVALLSDQSVWLDDLDERDHFSAWLDDVFNSCYLGQSKRDASTFDLALARLGAHAGSTLFVDDSADHCVRARDRGLHAIHFVDRESFLRQWREFFPADDVNPDR